MRSQLKAIFGAPVVVVDFGTATNMEVIDKDGVFVGGVIAPGVESSMRSLMSRAALLRAVELEDPGVAIGRDSSEAIQIGVVSGEAARVDGLVERIQAELGYKTKVVATGRSCAPHRTAFTYDHRSGCGANLTGAAPDL